MNLLYCPAYCEENVWHLCGHPAVADLSGYVLLVTNPQRLVPFFRHRQAMPDEPIVWDYHVLLLVNAPTGWQVWDQDSTLAMPIGLADYLRETFPGEADWPDAVRPCCRLVPAERYRRHFSSDRAHMRRDDGSWYRPPPPWPPILASGDLPLAKLLSMHDRHAWCSVDELPGLLNRHALPHKETP